MAKKWIKLASPSVALNAPNVTNKFILKYSPVIPWEMSAHEILEKKVPRGVRHLVFNCHGYVSRPNFAAPHLSLGTVFHPGNVSAFDVLMSIGELRVIWIAACNIGGSVDGRNFCIAMAKRSGCYVVTYTMAVPDAAVRSNHIEDFDYCMPAHIDPWGDGLSRQDFFARGGELGFSRA